MSVCHPQEEAAVVADSWHPEEEEETAATDSWNPEEKEEMAETDSWHPEEEETAAPDSWRRRSRRRPILGSAGGGDS
ncbi:hypothetical protein E2562_035390 [Oryza meyeriana var. granulata]|uniref:Uncharacterized protein n=1 Tax=Oryza meyeriana var. granulata TaxID=110450 RepID=A0A6G1E6T9_9ORYZ|nr:hypothetical protein E2562_035390 [Oryza meyeriana var. granulata]